MLRRFTPLLLWLFLIPSAATAQKATKLNQYVDSLLNVLSKTKQDTSRLILLNMIAQHYDSFNPDKGLEKADEAIALAKKLNKERGLSSSYFSKALNLKAKGDSKQALLFYDMARAINEKLNDVLGMGKDYTGMAHCYIGLADYDKAIEYYDKAYKIGLKTGNKIAIAANLNNIGLIYNRRGDYAQAIEYYKQAFAINEATDNKDFMAKNLGNIGSSYSRLADYPKSLEYHQKALKIHEALGNKSGMAINIGNIGNTYFLSGDYPQALEYMRQALQISEDIRDKDGMAINCTNIGNVYDAIADADSFRTGTTPEMRYAKTLEYYRKSLALSEEIGDKSSIAANLGNIGQVYKKMGDYINALSCYKKALEFNEQSGSKRSRVINLAKMGNLYREMPDSICRILGFLPSEKYAKALDYARRSLKMGMEIGTTDYVRNAWENLAKTYEATGQYDKAFEAYKNYIILRDSVNNTDKQKQMVRLQMQYDFDKKEAEYQYRQQLSDEQLQRQKQQLQLNTQALTLAHNEKEIEHLAYLNTQVLLDAESNKRQANEKERQLLAQKQSRQAAELKLKKAELAMKEKELQAKRTERNLYLLCGTLLIGAGVYSFYRFRQRKHMENKQALLNERLRLSRDLHDDIGSTLSSLNFYSEIATGKLKKQRQEEALDILNKMGTASRMMTERISDLVWSINPENDTLQHTADRLKSLAATLFQHTKISYLFDSNGIDEPVSLTIEQRKNLLLIYKEALNNIVKYAACKTVNIGLYLDTERLTLMIKDDGAGFDMQQSNNNNNKTGGNGLKNMKARAQQIGGELVIHSAKGKGTEISLSFAV